MHNKGLLRWTLGVLRKHGIRPRRRFSQNFVVCTRLVQDILYYLEQYSPPTILEVGAGLGTLSYFLSRRFKATVHVEIDPILAMIASEFVQDPAILIISDALDLEWNTSALVSNTPYHISSDILVKTAKSDSVKVAILVLQKDVVERLCAEPGSPRYGRITVLVKLVFDVRPGPVYPPSCFYPKPDVSSQMIVLSRRRKFSELLSCIEEVSRRLFIMRRKKARKVICKELGICDENILNTIGVEETTRIYQLTPRQIEELARLWRGTC